VAKIKTSIFDGEACDRHEGPAAMLVAATLS
jgi:hypothetical protein